MSSTPAAPGVGDEWRYMKIVHHLELIHYNKHELTPDPSPTQAKDSEPNVCTLNMNWNKREGEKEDILRKTL